MDREYSMTINRLPSKTWNWLRMNETKLEHIEIGAAEAGASVWTPEFAGIDSGMGADMDDLLARAGVTAKTYTVAEGEEASQPVFVDLQFADGAAEAEAVAVKAAKNSALTVIMDFSSEKEAKGQAAVSTRLFLEEGAKVRLIQVQRLGSEFTLLDDIGALCGENASLEVLQLILGGKDTYLGCKTTLEGKASSVNTDTAYIVGGDGRLDMNYIALHEGKKTLSDMQAGGVLRDHAFKLYRGTIDFKWGAKGAKGNEKEDVLLLSDDVVNQTIPLILCAEEDVEGNHGATIGKLDEELLFYLESRGMTREEIYEMMALAKVDAVSRKIPDAATRAKVDAFLGREVEEEEKA